MIRFGLIDLFGMELKELMKWLVALLLSLSFSISFHSFSNPRFYLRYRPEDYLDW